MTYRVMSNLRGQRATLLVTAANTIALTDLQKNGETITGLSISKAWLGSNGASGWASISRGANTVLVVNAGTEILDYSMLKVPMQLDSGASIVIAFGPGTNTLILELTKKSDKEDAV